MIRAGRVDPKSVVGRSPERLSLEEQSALCGLTIAVRIYTPEELPLQVIEGIGDTVEDCIADVVSRGQDPRRYEFRVLKPPY